MDESIEAQRAILDEHAKLIGNVAIAMNTAQSLVFSIFTEASGMKYDNAAAVFFALRADIAQREITLAVLDSSMGNQSPEVDKLRGWIKKPINKLNELANERNAAIHTMWTIGREDGALRITPSPAVIHNKSLEVNDAAGQMVRLERKLGSVIDALIKALVSLREYRAYRASLERPDPRHERRRGTRSERNRP